MLVDTININHRLLLSEPFTEVHIAPPANVLHYIGLVKIFNMK